MPQHGQITTPTGGRVLCRQTGSSWVWSCQSCGKGGTGTEQQVRTAGATHLRTRVMCAHRP